MSDQIGSASIGLAVDASGVDAGLNTMEATVARAGRSLSSLGRQGAQSIDGIAAGATSAASTTERATRRIQNEIQRVTAAAQAGERGTRAFYEALASQRGADLNTLRPYLDQLDQVRDAQQAAGAAALRSGSAFNTQSQSAAQLAANLRGVPAQLTDIVTSLQGGQAPLTVFLQQGGQLRDMFGSAGGAARALGGYLASLISPLTVGAAAVTALAVAYSQGSKEADAYRLSLVLTGNAAGVTTGQLSALAKQASEAAGTQGANAAALAQLVGTGKVAADQLAKASVTAVQSQKFLGIAVEETVKNFADLGKAPLQATLKLNEQYNYLTLATYNQIKALELQGKTSESAKVAQSAYADAMKQKSKEVEAGLGSLEKGWNFVGTAAKSAWDRMLDIGRESSIDEKIAAARKRLEDAQKGFQAAPVQSSVGLAPSLGFGTGLKDTKAQAKAQLDALLQQKDESERIAKIEAERVRLAQAGVAWASEGEQYLSRSKKLELELVASREKGLAAGESDADIATRALNIRRQYADVANASIEAQIAAVGRLAAAQEAAAQRAKILLQGDQDAGLNKAFDRQDAYQKAMSKIDAEVLQRQKAALQRELELTAQKTVSIDEQIAHQQKLADLRSEIAKRDVDIGNRQLQLSIDLRNADIARNRSAFEMLDNLLDSRTADTEALKQQLQAQNDQNAAIGLSGKALEAFNTKLVEERATRLELKADILNTIPARAAEAEELRKQAQLLRDLNKAQIEGARKTANVKVYQEFWESVDHAAQDAFTHIFEGGKSVFDRLKDSLKTGLLDVLYQLTVKQFIVNVKTNLSGDLFSNLTSALNPSASGSSGSSLLGTATNLFSIGKTIYSGFSAGIASSLGTQIAGLGNLFGSQAVSAFGTGMTLTTSQAATAAGAYGAAGNTAAAGGLTAGAGAASAIPIIGWIIAGMMANDDFYKQGYRIDGQRGDITKELMASTLKGNILGPIGATATVGIGAADSLLRTLGLDSRTASLLSGSSLWAKAFGRQSPTIQEQGIQGTITASGVTGESYAKILEKGGWFRSDKRYTNTQVLDTDTDSRFDKQVTSIISAVKGFGSALGEQTSQIDSYSKQFKLMLTGKADEDEKAVAALFAGIGDDLATLLVPSIAKLSAEGESAAATLARVANDYTVMNAALGAIGLNFGAVGVSSLEAREKLIALTGGLDSFVSQAEFFSQNFLSEAERTAAVQKQLQSAFGDLGVKAIPKTRDEFAALVKSLDLTSDGGQKTYAGLMNLQQAFASVTPFIDKAALLQQEMQLQAQKQAQQRQLDIQLMEVLGNSEGALAATRNDALDALLTDQARIAQAQIYAAQDAKKVYDSLVGVADGALARLTTSINAEKDRINSAYNSQAQAIRDATSTAVKSAQESLQAAQDQANAIQTVFNALDGALNSIKIESDAATLARRQSAQATLGAALTNPAALGSNKALAEALSTITGQGSERLFGTFEEYARDQARTNNTIAALKAVAGEQVDNAALTVKRLGDNIDAIQRASEKQLAQLQIDTQAQLDKLDQQLAGQTAQIDALKGIDNSVLSVKSAVEMVAAAINNLKSNPTGQQNSTDIFTAQINELYRSVLGREGKQEGINFWVNALKSGVGLDQIRREFMATDEYKNLQAIKTPIQSVSADQTYALMARVSDSNQNNAALLAEVQRLNVLTAAQQVTLDAIAEATGIAGDVLDKAQKGQPLATESK
jgi:phage-related minor tail protein